jgi:hypothetical protein
MLQREYGRTTMTNTEKAYDDLIEIGACLVACSDLTGRAVPRRVHELISEAADLRGAWAAFSEAGSPGTADLPLVDAVIDDVNVRASALRNEIVGTVRRAAQYAAAARRPATPADAPGSLHDMAMQMRRALGR